MHALRARFFFRASTAISNRLSSIEKTAPSANSFCDSEISKKLAEIEEKSILIDQLKIELEDIKNRFNKLEISNNFIEEKLLDKNVEIVG
jgi:hypothetical protein